MLPIKPAEVAVEGNAQVVELLEKWLERAKQGKLAFAIVVACDNLKGVISNHAGSLQHAFGANWGLDTAKYQLMAKVTGRHLEPMEANALAGGNKVCYNISKGPACFDFIAWLVLAEMKRVQEGAPAPLRVGFTMVDTPEERARHEQLRKAMYDGVIFPSLAFVGAVADPEACDAPEIDKYTIAPIVELANLGIAVPKLKPSAAALKAIEQFLANGPAPVTITLREADYMEFRNSNLDEWLKVAGYLQDRGERVIFVRDTAKATELITGFETCPAASIDLDIRLALYESAKCNLAVSNGPWMLMLFGTRPWLAFIEVDPLMPYHANTPQFWREWHGLDPLKGEQYPWCLPTQRIVWTADTYEHIVKAWQELNLDAMQQAAE